MANIASQKKRILRSEQEHEENRRLKSAIKTHFRRFESAVESGNGDSIETEHRTLIARIDKAVQGALHERTGGRKKSRAAHASAHAAPRS